MAARYWAIGRTGGVAGTLDDIDPTDTNGSAKVLVEGDYCIVSEDDAEYRYIARDSAGAVESDPDVIIPDTNPSNWWWELTEVTYQNTGMMNQLAYENMPGAF